MLENLHKPIGRKLLIYSMSNRWKPDNGYTLQTSTPWFPYCKKRTSKISKTFHDMDEAVTENSFPIGQFPVQHICWYGDCS